MEKNNPAKKGHPISSEIIENAILFIRGQKVLLDDNLAELYCVETKRLLESMKRNIERFPEDFVFQLTKEEWNSLRSQFATSKKGRGGRRYMPFVFTEQGVAMLSSILRSKRAVSVNIEIMRAFVHLRRILSIHKDLEAKLTRLEKRHDAQFKVVFDVIHKLIMPPDPKHPPIGFKLEDIDDQAG
ncbi:MAG: ORF6N domain-containing protein [bacterium]|nr:ORF6N domain-containing protein [bacterium]